MLAPAKSAKFLSTLGLVPATSSSSQNKTMSKTVISSLNEDAQRLARFASFLVDAHSCFIFLPSETQQPSVQPEANIVNTGIDFIQLSGFASRSKFVAERLCIQVGQGVIGWVASQGRALHLAPFEVESSTAHLYIEKCEIKALLAVPIECSGLDKSSSHGAIVCDSLNPNGFSKKDIRSIEEIAVEVARIYRLSKSIKASNSVIESLDTFNAKVNELSNAIGENSIDFVKIKLPLLGFESIQQLSENIGTYSKFCRLISESLPPHFPVFKTPEGDLLIAVDNMMTTFFEGKIRALMQRLGSSSKVTTPVIWQVITPAHSGKGRSHGRSGLASSNQQTIYTEKRRAG